MKTLRNFDLDYRGGSIPVSERKCEDFDELCDYLVVLQSGGNHILQLYIVNNDEPSNKVLTPIGDEKSYTSRTKIMKEHLRKGKKIFVLVEKDNFGDRSFKTFGRVVSIKKNPN